MHSDRGLLEHIMLRSRHRTAGDRQRFAKRHQRAADLGIGGRVDLSAFGISEEVVNHVIGALTIIATGSCCVVTRVLSTGIVHGRLAEVEAMVGRGLGCIVATSMTCLVSESGGVGSHLAIVIVIAGRA
jgi:hypothetical protein